MKLFLTMILAVSSSVCVAMNPVTCLPDSQGISPLGSLVAGTVIGSSRGSTTGAYLGAVAATILVTTGGPVTWAIGAGAGLTAAYLLDKKETPQE